MFWAFTWIHFPWLDLFGFKLLICDLNYAYTLCFFVHGKCLKTLTRKGSTNEDRQQEFGKENCRKNRLMGIYQVQKHTVVASVMPSSGCRVPCTLHLSTVRKSPVYKQTKTQKFRQDLGINDRIADNRLMQSHSWFVCQEKSTLKEWQCILNSLYYYIRDFVLQKLFMKIHWRYLLSKMDKREGGKCFSIFY